MTKQNPHKNATVVAGGTGVTALIIWVASLVHVTLTAYDAIVVLGALAGLRLFIGRNWHLIREHGVKGLVAIFWHGDKATIT